MSEKKLQHGSFALKLLIIVSGLCPNKQNFWGKIVNIFLSMSLNIYFGCSEEPSHSCFFWLLVYVVEVCSLVNI